MKKQFEKLQAAEIYCPKCKMAQPVHERLMLALPHMERYEYRCRYCATSLGQREVKGPALRTR